LKSRQIALMALIASLYAIGTIALAPISYGIVQVRVADALIPLSIILGMPAVLGVTLGCIVANYIGGLGAVDIILGSLANFIAGYVGMKLKDKKLLACVIQCLIITFIVGGYLWAIFGVSPLLSLAGVGLGSVISIVVLGYALIRVLEKFMI